MKSKTALMILLAAMLAVSSRAQTVTETDLTLTGGSFAGIGSNNLIQNNPGTNSTLSISEPTGGWTIAGLTDGDVKAPGAVGNGIGVYGGISGGTITYNLPAAAEITGIQTWTVWTDGGRINPKYTVSYSTDGSNFTNLHTVNYTATGGNGTDVSLAISGLTNVVAIKFDFSGGQQNGWVVYTELAVYGDTGAPLQAPTFTVIPQSQTVTNSQSVTFTATATGWPIPTIAWHFVDTNSVDTLLSTVGDTLTIANVDIGTHLGHYYAVASNSQGTTNSPLAQLTIVDNGVTVTVDNSGFPYQPVGANDVILGNAGANIALNNFETTGGWTPANLTDGNPIDPFGVGNGNGVYSLIGNNGTITYHLGGPTTITGVQSWTGWANGNRNNQNYTFAYSLDGTNFINLHTVANNPSLQWGNLVTLNITGLSNVVSVRFNFGLQENGGVAYTELAVYGTLEVVPVAPVFTVIPQSQTGTNGESVTFTAAATGVPTPVIQWHFVDTNSVDTLLPTIGGTLTFTANFTNAGQYYAVASNSAGTTNSPSAVLTVVLGPVTETDLSLSGGSFAGMGTNNLLLNNSGNSASLSFFEVTGGWTPTNLTDGDLKAPGTVGNGNGVYSIIGGGSVTYDLGGGTNATGNDLTGIQTWTVWSDGGRINPKYTVSYSLDGVNFTSLRSVNYSASGGANGTDVSIAINTSLSNVRYVKFDFSGGQQNGGVVYTELAAYGTSSAPGNLAAYSATRDFWEQTKVSVVFNQPLDPASATNAANYAIDQGASVSAASVSSAPNGLTTVVLTTSPLTAGNSYVLTINNVADAGSNPIAPNTQLAISIPVTSDVVRAPYAFAGTEVLVLEAEHFSLNTAGGGKDWIVTNLNSLLDVFPLLPQTADTNISNSEFVFTTDTGSSTSFGAGAQPTGTPRLDYKVYFPTAGDYRVWVRGAATNANNDSINLGLNGIYRYRINGGYTATNGFVWVQTPNNPSGAVLTVTNAGLHVFNAWMREDGFIVDKFIIVPSNSVAAYIPTGVGPSESGGPGITVIRSGADVILTWPGGGVLQSSTNVVGTYADIPGSSSPWTNAAAGGQKYYRVRQ